MLAIRICRFQRGELTTAAVSAALLATVSTALAAAVSALAALAALVATLSTTESSTTSATTSAAISGFVNADSATIELDIVHGSNLQAPISNQTFLQEIKHQLTAASASESLVNRTNPKPRDLPVSRSLTTTYHTIIS